MPVFYTGGDELFNVKMDIAKVKGMMDANGDLQYSRIFDDLLPTLVMSISTLIWQQGRVPT